MEYKTFGVCLNDYESNDQLSLRKKKEMLLKTGKRLVPLVNRAIAKGYTVSMAYGMVWHILACLL